MDEPAAPIAARSDEHARLRAGKISSSVAGIIASGGPQAWNTLLDKLRHERKEPRLFQEHTGIAALDHGTATEPRARSAYLFATGLEPDASLAWIPHGTLELCGTSPDFVVQPDGFGEIKCPLLEHRHLRCFADGVPPEHGPQIWHHLEVRRQAAWLDFVSYQPFQPPALQLFVARIHRAEIEEQLLAYRARLIQFHELLESGEEARRPSPSLELLDKLHF